MKLYIGIDAHSTHHTLSAFNPFTGEYIAETEVKSSSKSVIKFIGGLEKITKESNEVQCGYEAGCLGFTLYDELTKAGIPCLIMAPTTIATVQCNKKTKKKNDKRDARAIAQALAYGTYSSVHIPNTQDLEIREYLRMRDDHKIQLKKIKQQILAFCLRNGFVYEGTKNKWTKVHLQWLRTLQMSPMLRRVLDEYLYSFDRLTTRLEDMDNRIEEMASLERYEKNVKALRCLRGIETHTALSLIVETSDFIRFDKASNFSAFLGLVPGMNDSSDHHSRLPITKAGNSHLRRLLIESAHTYQRGVPGLKSKKMKAKQKGCDEKIIKYADKANDRLIKKFKRIQNRNGKVNIAATAVARELACYVWGMMTDHIC